MKESFRESTHDSTETSKWSILSNYDEAEQQRIQKYDDYIENTKNNSMNFSSAETRAAELESKKIEKMPSKMRKFGRVLLDVLNIQSPKSIDRREREAMAIAVENHRLRLRQQEVERKQEELRRQQEEQDKLANEIFDTAAAIRQRRRQQERIQEKEEREINESLTKLDDLDQLSYIPESGVTARTEDYEENDVTVYRVDIPFCGIAHNVTYNQGSPISKRLSEDPSMWNKDEYEVMSEDPEYKDHLTYHGFVHNYDKVESIEARRHNGRGNLISVSYFDTKTNSKPPITADLQANFYYGYQKIAPKSLLKISRDDANTNNLVLNPEDSIDLHKNDFNKMKDAERTKGAKDSYNELLLRRFDVNGDLLVRPDYILTYYTDNKKLSESALKHAAYYGIPIVEIPKYQN